jgi:hypothetical protein
VCEYVCVGVCARVRACVCSLTVMTESVTYPVQIPARAGLPFRLNRKPVVPQAKPDTALR